MSRRVADDSCISGGRCKARDHWCVSYDQSSVSEMMSFSSFSSRRFFIPGGHPMVSILGSVEESVHINYNYATVGLHRAYFSWDEQQAMTHLHY